MKIKPESKKKEKNLIAGPSGAAVGEDRRFGFRELIVRMGTDLYGAARKPKA